jgi:hypothetical protein
VCYVDLSNNEVLIERSFVVQSSDPLTLTDVAIRLKKMPIPHSGVYAWELYCDGDLIGTAFGGPQCPDQKPAILRYSSLALPPDPPYTSAGVRYPSDWCNRS